MKETNKEISNANFGDKRLNKRMELILESLTKSPVSRLLLTTLPINTIEDALKYIYWYSLRWLIERYHYVLKSGCQVEKL